MQYFEEKFNVNQQGLRRATLTGGFSVKLHFKTTWRLKLYCASSSDLYSCGADFTSLRAIQLFQYWADHAGASIGQQNWEA